MTLSMIAGIALSLGASPTEANLVAAIAQQESSCRTDPPLGDNGKSWGCFQFQLDRWLECGGTSSQYGKATPNVQVRVMLQGIRARVSSWEKMGWNPKESDQRLVNMVCRWHNIGHCLHNQRDRMYAYSKAAYTTYRSIPADITFATLQPDAQAEQPKAVVSLTFRDAAVVTCVIGFLVGLAWYLATR